MHKSAGTTCAQPPKIRGTLAPYGQATLVPSSPEVCTVALPPVLPRVPALRGAPPGRLVARGLLRVASRLTTPLLPDDYLGMVAPLWSTRELRARVEQVLPEADGATTLVLRPGPDWRGHVPGQSVRVAVELDGVRHWRSYSLSSPPRPDGRLTLTVKAVPGGSVSRQLARSTPVGAVLPLGQASGEFHLPATVTRPLLFVTAGSGLTPVMAMLRGLAPTGVPDAVLVHSAPTADRVLFGAELRGLARDHRRFRLVERHTAVDGRLDLADLDALVPDWQERQAWVCGPAGLLDAAEQRWAGLPGRLAVERFRPRLLADDGTQGGPVTFARSGRTVETAGGILDAGEGAGVLMPSGCRMGICHGCVVPLLQGRVRDLRTGAVHGEEGDLVQTCVSAPCGPVELDL